MPYKISKVQGGYKVAGPHGTDYSRKPQTRQMAEKQRRAIAMSEFGRGSQKG